jgi:hypothetical protein
MIHTIKKRIKRILANCVAVPAIPLNPRKAAMMAIMRNTRDQWSMVDLLFMGCGRQASFKNTVPL